MLRATYDAIVRQAEKPAAIWVMAMVAFAESSIFPLPPDILLIPMTLANRQKAFLYATVGAGASVIGGLVGYSIGYFLFESVGRSIIDFYGLEESFAHFSQVFHEYGAWILILKGATPVPYKLLTITAGFTQLDLTTFVLASLVSRSLRFYIFAVLLWYFGEPMRNFVERRLGLVALILVALMVGGFMVVKLF